MKTMKYDKLVRDKIPEIIRKKGKEFTYRKASDEEYFFYLKKKLVEEVREFMEKPSLKEMADVQEVMNFLVKELGHTQPDLRMERSKKNEDRGSFHDRWILEEVRHKGEE